MYIMNFNNDLIIISIIFNDLIIIIQETGAYAELCGRVASLQSGTEVRDEKIAHLEIGSKSMAQDLVNKAAIIQHYCIAGIVILYRRYCVKNLTFCFFEFQNISPNFAVFPVFGLWVNLTVHDFPCSFPHQGRPPHPHPHGQRGAESIQQAKGSQGVCLVYLFNYFCVISSYIQQICLKYSLQKPICG